MWCSPRRCPTGSTFVAAGSHAGWDCNGGNPGQGDGAIAGTVCTAAVGTVNGGGVGGSRPFQVRVVDPVPAGVASIHNAVVIDDDVCATSCDEDEEDTPVEAAPIIDVAKTDGKTKTFPGDVLTYTITVSNLGNEDATDVQVVETLPAHTSFVAVADAPGNAAWTSLGGGLYAQTISNLAVGTPVALTFTVKVDANVAENVTNVVNTVSACLNRQDCDTATDDDTLDAAPELTITKDDGETLVGPGQTLTYTIEYANTGNQTATALSLTETVPTYTTADPADLVGWVCVDSDALTADMLEAGSTCTKAIGDLDGGDDGKAAFVVTVDATVPTNASTVVNTVGLVDNGQTVDNAVDVDDLAHEAVITVVKEDLDNDDVVAPGGTLTYVITISNSGTKDATGVEVTETVPEHTHFVVGGEGNAAWSGPDSGVYSLTVDVPANGSVERRFTVQVDDTVGVDAFVVHNEVQACLDDDCDTGDDDDTLVADAVISVEKENEGDDGAVVPGETIVYVITVSNTGDRDIEDVVVTETVPGFTAFVEDAEGNDAWTLDGDEYVASVDVAAGASEELTFTVKVQASVPAGALGIHNSVTACPAAPVLQFARLVEIIDALEIFPVEGCSTGEDDDDLDAAPDLTVVKDDDGITVDLGGQVTYTIDYANTGDQDATGVVLTETVPTGSTFVGPADWACAGTTCIADIGDLAAGASGSIQFTVKVDAALASGQTDLDNVVVISDDGENGEDPNPEDNTGTDDTPVRPPEVLPGVVTRPTPPTQVQGAQLPRTGSDADQMLLLAGLLTMVGGLLLVAESVVDQRRRRVMVVRR